MGKNPAFQYYPKDWRSDPVWGASLAARGLWHEMMDRMHESKQYGYLSANGKPMTDEQIARLCGTTPSEYVSLLVELDGLGVPRRTASGIIFCKRMVEDEKKRSEWRKRQSKHRVTARDISCDIPTVSRGSPISDLPTPSSKLRSKTLAQKPGLFPGFEMFWQAYPKKLGGRDTALKAWKSKVCNDDDWPVIVAGVGKWQQSGQWDDYKYIPYPTTFLNQMRWLDEVPPRGANVTGNKAAELSAGNADALNRVFGNSQAGNVPNRIDTQNPNRSPHDHRLPGSISRPTSRSDSSGIQTGTKDITLLPKASGC